MKPSPRLPVILTVLGLLAVLSSSGLAEESRRHFLATTAGLCAGAVLSGIDTVLAKEPNVSEPPELGLRDFGEQVLTVLIRLDPANADQYRKGIEVVKWEVWDSIQTRLASKQGAVRKTQFWFVRTFSLSNRTFVDVMATFEAEGTDDRVVTRQTGKLELVVKKIKLKALSITNEE